MKRLLEILISLIFTAAVFALLQIVYVLNLFNLVKIVPPGVPIALAVVIGLIFYFIFSSVVSGLLLRKMAQTEDKLIKMNIKELAMSVFGCIIGLAIANLVGIAFNSYGPLGTGIVILLNFVLGFMGFRVAQRKKDDFNASALKNIFTSGKGTTTLSAGRPKILDTSVIIDGRIIDLLNTGFIEGKILIPHFVLDELRHIADSSDKLKRQRGRRGLDILNEIQKQLSIPVEIVEYHTKQPMEVDAMLLKMAEKMDAFVVTNDFNLNKVAEFQGVHVLNINELANAIKPVVLPGEEMNIMVIKAGKENGQGIAYLNDGTMIVVEGGNKFIGETLTVIVTSVLQTAAGRMIFTKIDSAA